MGNNSSEKELQKDDWSTTIDYHTGHNRSQPKKVYQNTYKIFLS